MPCTMLTHCTTTDHELVTRQSRHSHKAALPPADRRPRIPRPHRSFSPFPAALTQAPACPPGTAGRRPVVRRAESSGDRRRYDAHRAARPARVVGSSVHPRGRGCQGGNFGRGLDRMGAICYHPVNGQSRPGVNDTPAPSPHPRRAGDAGRAVRGDRDEHRPDGHRGIPRIAGGTGPNRSRAGCHPTRRRAGRPRPRG